MPGLAISFDNNKTPERTVRGVCDRDTTREEVIDFAKKLDSRADTFGWGDLRLNPNLGTWSIIIYTD